MEVCCCAASFVLFFVVRCLTRVLCSSDVFSYAVSFLSHGRVPPMQEHSVFRRKGADLVIEKNLTLVESLCGFDFSITHMDKRTLRVRSNPGQVRLPTHPVKVYTNTNIVWVGVICICCC